MLLFRFPDSIGDLTGGLRSPIGSAGEGTGGT
jgi:hypothetical protein